MTKIYLILLLFSLSFSSIYAQEASLKNKLYIHAEGIELINQNKHLVLKSILNEAIRLQNYEVSLVDKEILEALRVSEESDSVFLLVVKVDKQGLNNLLTVSLFNEKKKILLKKISKVLNSKSSPISDISTGIKIILKNLN